MKILSVSVAAYNSEKYIRKCLDSFVVSEILDDIEIIVVNDGSVDRTAEIVKEYADRYPGTFVLINKENGGHGSTINYGIKRASGKYFKIVDSDDWVEREGIIELVNKLKAMTVDAVFSPFYKIDTEGKKYIKQSISKIDSKRKEKILNINKERVEYDLYMHALTFRTELLKEHFTTIDEHCFYVDMEYLVFYFRFVRTIYVSTVPVYNYLIGTAEQSMSMKNRVNRRDQHMHVCTRIMEYYQGTDNARIIRGLIENMILSQYRILLAIPDASQSQEEIMVFDSYIKKHGSLYQESIINAMKRKKETAYVVFMLRKFKFHGYKLIHAFFQ